LIGIKKSGTSQNLFVLLNNYAISDWEKMVIDLGFLSIVMASLASVFNAISTIFEKNFYTGKIYDEKSWEVQLMNKLAVVLVAFISVILILLLKNAGFVELVNLFRFWISFAIITLLLHFFSRIMIVGPVVILLAYITGVILNFIPIEIFSTYITIENYALLTKLTKIGVFENQFLILTLILILLTINFIISRLSFLTQLV